MRYDEIWWDMMRSGEIGWRGCRADPDWRAGRALQGVSGRSQLTAGGGTPHSPTLAAVGFRSQGSHSSSYQLGSTKAGWLYSQPCCRWDSWHIFRCDNMSFDTKNFVLACTHSCMDSDRTGQWPYFVRPYYDQVNLEEHFEFGHRTRMMTVTMPNMNIKVKEGFSCVTRCDISAFNQHRI